MMRKRGREGERREERGKRKRMRWSKVVMEEEEDCNDVSGRGGGERGGGDNVRLILAKCTYEV